MRVARSAARLLPVVLFGVGVLLLLLNMLGWVIPLRSPGVYALKDGRDVSISYEQAVAQVDRRAGETETVYIYRLHGLVSQSMGHYWEGDGLDAFRLRIPPWENYILWAYSFTQPQDFRKYEIADYRLALQRGVGLCSQHAMLLDAILKRNGIQSKIIEAQGHVVASAQADGKWYILDADYEVLLPYSFDEVEQNPELVRSFYPDNPETLIEIFGSVEDNREFDSYISYHTPRLVKLEQRAYALKWLVPLGLITAALLMVVVRLVPRAAPGLFARVLRVL
jgi:hypothetical protein